MIAFLIDWTLLSAVVALAFGPTLRWLAGRQPESLAERIAPHVFALAPQARPDGDGPASPGTVPVAGDRRSRRG